LQHANRYNADIGNADGVVPVEEDIDEHEKRDAEFDMMEKSNPGTR
jgi:hypothetical protein